MDWLKITAETSGEGLEPVCAALQALGFDALEIEDSDDFDDFVVRQKPRWQLVDEGLAESMKDAHRVSFYVPDDQSAADAVHSARDALSVLRGFGGERLDPPAVKVSHLNERDWMENWRKYYKPISIGRRVLIQPEWEPLSNPEGRVVFRCEPGVSFGTGTHATTRLCLELLDEWVKPGMKVADLGCGSGILSVTALLLGAKRAVAADIDPQAVRTAKRNAELNGFPGMEVLCGDLLSEPPLWDKLKDCDIVCANLVADLIKEMAPRLAACLKPGGRLFASGILTEYAGEVSAALTGCGLEPADAADSEGWSALHLVKAM